MTLRIALADAEPARLKSFTDALLQKEGCIITFVSSADKLLSLLAQKGCDVVIIGDRLDGTTPMALIMEVTKKFPLINTAMISNLPHDAFHDSTEGLGVFMQLPTIPDGATAVEFFEKLGRIQFLLGA